jgi:pimeloyl-ACP methyl ester carboxylesterase
MRDITLRDVSTRGARLRVADTGEGPPVVCLHGFLSSHRSFAAFGARASNAHRVVSVDLPGHGASEKPSPDRYRYDFDTMADSVLDVIAALGLGRVTLLGHGLGAGVALSLAQGRPEIAQHLVLVVPQLASPRGPLPRPLLRAPVLGDLSFRQVLGRGAFRRYFAHNVYASSTDETRALVDECYASFNTPAARQAAFAIFRHTQDTRSTVARLPRVTVPTLVVWGQDEAQQGVEAGRRLLRMLPAARLEVLPGTSPHEEVPASFFEVVAAFLRRKLGA